MSERDPQFDPDQPQPPDPDLGPDQPQDLAEPPSDPDADPEQE